MAAEGQGSKVTRKKNMQRARQRAENGSGELLALAIQVRGHANKGDRVLSDDAIADLHRARQVIKRIISDDQTRREFAVADDQQMTVEECIEDAESEAA